jgi:hypothetical protein
VWARDHFLAVGGRGAKYIYMTHTDRISRVKEARRKISVLHFFSLARMYRSSRPNLQIAGQFIFLLLSGGGCQVLFLFTSTMLHTQRDGSSNHVTRWRVDTHTHLGGGEDTLAGILEVLGARVERKMVEKR